MPTPTRKFESHAEMVQERGQVVLAEGRDWMVRTRSGAHRARRAVSCLVEPEVEDRVLLVIEGDQAWVLAVLERSPGAAVRLAAEGDLSLNLPGGRFTAAAQDGIELVSGSETALVSPDLRIDATRACVSADQLSFLGRLLQGEVEGVKLVAGFFDSILDRLSRRVKRSYRVVEEVDQLRAEQIDYTARKNARIHGQNAILTAQDLVKVDGEQIHVG